MKREDRRFVADNFAQLKDLFQRLKTFTSRNDRRSHFSIPMSIYNSAPDYQVFERAIGGNADDDGKMG